MKFETKQEGLKEALNCLVKVTNPKFDVYAGIKIIKKDDTHLELQATNGILTMRCIIEADKIEGDYEIVEASKLFNIVNRLSGYITYQGGVIKSGKSKLKVDVLNIELPELKPLEGQVYNIEAAEFKQALKNRLYTTDMTSQGVLSGVFLNGNEIVSTNGNVLSLSKLATEIPLKETTISRQFAAEIVRCFDDSITLTLNNNKISVQNDYIYLECVLLLGKYPNYSQLIPKLQEFVNIDKIELLNKLSLLTVVEDMRVPIVKLEFQENVLKLSVKDGEDSLEIDYTGKTKTVHFNLTYLIESLKNIEGDVISIGLNEPLSPWLLQNENELILIMPIQVK